MMNARTLQTVPEIITELGGPTAVGRITDRSPQSVVNWRAAARFPAKTFLILQSELAARNIEAPPSLWGIKEPA
jgi:hypothetical protein